MRIWNMTNIVSLANAGCKATGLLVYLVKGVNVERLGLEVKREREAREACA